MASLANSTNSLDDAYEACRLETAEWAKTFYLGTLLLPLEKRRAIWAIYVWCRRTDELMDSAEAQLRSIAELSERLDRWEQKTRAVFDGHVEDDLPLPNDLENQLGDDEHILVDVLREAEPVLDHERQGAAQRVAVEELAPSGEADDEQRGRRVMEQRAEELDGAPQPKAGRLVAVARQVEVDDGLRAAALPQPEHEEEEPPVRVRDEGDGDEQGEGELRRLPEVLQAVAREVPRDDVPHDVLAAEAEDEDGHPHRVAHEPREAPVVAIVTPDPQRIIIRTRHK